MDNFTFFDQLLHAETEDDVDQILAKSGYLEDEAAWQAIGGLENNFAAIGNQQSDPSGALVEKVINSIDAVLMAECYIRQINPEGPSAPKTMTAAVEQFFGVRHGRLDYLSSSELTQLADNIHLVAVGSKENPNYLIIDRGEGQTPAKFPDTFLSLMKSNKIRIPFVQGKFNSGGTGILQFCGRRNYQLIVSRRRPGCPVEPDDNTADLWGFTIVRRLLPSDGRRSSMYVYLAPNMQVPSFHADAVKILPGKSGPNRPGAPYAVDISFGTCVKLYNYQWKAKSIITTDSRYELERFLHTPCLPFRVSETRDYRANFFSATIKGGWATATSEDDGGEVHKLEDGFPYYADLNIGNVGQLPYQVAVYKQGIKKRHVPYGVFFVVNGQVHGAFPTDFVSRRLKFDYLAGNDNYGPLLVSVDCTRMNERVREDFFMASRDRIRKNEVYNLIEQKLIEALKGHPGLQELNQSRRKHDLETSLNEKAPIDAFQKILDLDPTLSSLFAAGDRLVTSTGPMEKPPFIGRKFPTFFRITNEPKEGLVKPCALNRTCRIEFETDAVNDYFKRAIDPGRITFNPPDLVEHTSLWNGRFEARLRVPWNAKPEDKITITVKVTDIEREGLGVPFKSTFIIKATPEVYNEPVPGPAPRPRGPQHGRGKKGVVLALPTLTEVHKEDWEKYGFGLYTAMQIRHDGQGGYDCFVNVDNTFLITELTRTKEDDKPLVKFWFSYGLILSALGMIRHQMREAENEGKGKNRNKKHQQHDDEESEVNLEDINRYCNGLAQVIIPIIRTLYRGPVNIAA